MEVLTFILSSHEENFDMLNRADDKSKAVIIANPRTSEFEVNFPPSPTPVLGAAISQLSYVLSIDYSAKNSVNFWLIDAFLAKRFLTTCPNPSTSSWSPTTTTPHLSSLASWHIAMSQRRLLLRPLPPADSTTR